MYRSKSVCVCVCEVWKHPKCSTVGLSDYRRCHIDMSEEFNLMSGEDDWLWECALNQHEESRTAAAQTKFLVPEWEEEAHHFVPSKGHQRHHTARVYPSNSNDITDIVIRVVEIRGNGVLDTIGGEVWEASLLLCAYILLNPQRFLSVSALELGSGLGLPVFLITELRRLLLHHLPTSSTSSTATCSQQGKRTCLTDNDPRCIDTLIATVQNRYNDHHHHDEDILMIPSVNHCCLSVATLDWNSFRGKAVRPHLYEHSTTTTTNTDTAVDKQVTIDSVNPSNIPELSTDHPLHPNHYQLLFGSALVYSPYHVCLADTILHFMQAGACQRVCIVQIADRAGFDEFLQRLTGLGLLLIPSLNIPYQPISYLPSQPALTFPLT